VVTKDDGDSVMSKLGTEGSDDEGVEAAGNKVALDAVVEVSRWRSQAAAPHLTSGSCTMIISTSWMTTVEGMDGRLACQKGN
jgi:hypothetical protein